VNVLTNTTNADAGQVIGKATSGLLVTVRASLPRLWLVVLLAVALHAGGVGTAWAQSTADEYHVKAAFLLHFAQLVEWPANTPTDGGSPLILCTLGDDPFHGELENTVAGKQIGSRIIRIRHVKPSQVSGCNLLFVSKGEDKRLPMLLANLRDAPVLTVGEGDDFLISGGIIRFCLDGKKIRFEINREAAESARLRISSQLLLLAKNVVVGNGRK
jgi:YfiR/HmsC-like